MVVGSNKIGKRGSISLLLYPQHASHSAGTLYRMRMLMEEGDEEENSEVR
jgi:hypothetical protein